eukprot:COSAG01_NODE_46593_length_398_cov_26.541806_2_plen_56_part_01
METPGQACVSIRCRAVEAVSQDITIPWNADKLYFKHRRDSAGQQNMYGSYVRLLIT